MMNNECVQRYKRQNSADFTSTNVDVTVTAVDVTTTNVDVAATNVDVTVTNVDVTVTTVDVTTTNVDVTTTAVDVTATNVDVTTAAVDVSTSHFPFGALKWLMKSFASLSNFAAYLKEHDANVSGYHAVVKAESSTIGSNGSCN